MGRNSGGSLLREPGLLLLFSIASADAGVVFRAAKEGGEIGFRFEPVFQVAPWNAAVVDIQMISIVANVVFVWGLKVDRGVGSQGFHRLSLSRSGGFKRAAFVRAAALRQKERGRQPGTLWRWSRRCRQRRRSRGIPRSRQ